MGRPKELYKFQGTGLQAKELSWAKERFKEYQKYYHIESFSNLQLLEELVYEEANLERIKKNIQEILEVNSVKKNNLVPRNLLEERDKSLDRQLKLKDKLGLFNDTNKQDLYNYIDILKKKHSLYRKQNPLDYSFPCPHCSKMIHAKAKINNKSHIITQHPFFEDRFLNNTYIIKMYQEGKITKEDIAQMIKVPLDYVNFIIDKLEL